MKDYSKYIFSTGTHYISNSGSDENGKYNSGKAGDQNGKEWQLRSFYSRPWTVVLRYPNAEARELFANLSCAAALNDNIGYDQYQRYTYLTQLEAANWNPENITVACEEDCTAGVTANWKAVGHIMGIDVLANLDKTTRSTNMKSRFVKAGFIALTEKKYLTSGKYLLPGDVLLYESHHAAANITKGALAEDKTFFFGDRELKKGDKGEDVRILQTYLLSFNYDLGKYGADGDFGSWTELAVKAFQKDKGLDVTGIVDAVTVSVLTDCVNDGSKKVKIINGNCYIRTEPSIYGAIKGVAKKGEKYEYGGTTKDGWNSIQLLGETVWVSGKYSRLE